jgi:hypothetical protein
MLETVQNKKLRKYLLNKFLTAATSVLLLPILRLVLLLLTSTIGIS